MARQTPVNANYSILSGSGTGTNAERIDVWAEYQLGASNVAANTTYVTVYFYAALASGYSSSTKNVSGLYSALTVNGSSATGVSGGSYDFTSTENVNYLGSYSGDIMHNSDGTGTLVISGSFHTPSAYISGGTVEGTIQLPAIARESTVWASAANIEESTVISVNRKNPDFTHSIRYEFGTLWGYIGADWQPTPLQVKLWDTNISFTIPREFYGQIPNAASGSCTLYINTYLGDVQIGQQQSCSFTVTAAANQCAPTLSGKVEDCDEVIIQSTGNANSLVRYLSNALCTMTASAKNGASIVKRRIGGVEVESDSRVIENIETDTVEFYVEDSRGYSNTVTVRADMIPYVWVTCNPVAKRTDPTSGNAQLTITGNYYPGSFGARENTLTIFCSVNGQQMQLTPTINAQDNTYTAQLFLSGLDYQSAHAITVYAMDQMLYLTKPLILGKGTPVFDWSEHDFRVNEAMHVKSVNGVYMQSVRVWGERSFYLQSGFSQWTEAADMRQSLLLFGSANGKHVQGVLSIYNDSTCFWSGTEGVSVSAGESGAVTVDLGVGCYDEFVLISAQPYRIL